MAYLNSVVLQPSLIQFELHAQCKVGILDCSIGDQEWHGGQGCQSVHVPNQDEDQGDSGNHEQRVNWHFVWSLLQRIYFR